VDTGNDAAFPGLLCSSPHGMRLGSIVQRREFIAAIGGTAGLIVPPSRLARADEAIE
jgi:hypothetical protein